MAGDARVHLAPVGAAAYKRGVRSGCMPAGDVRPAVRTADVFSAGSAFDPGTFGQAMTSTDQARAVETRTIEAELTEARMIEAKAMRPRTALARWGMRAAALALVAAGLAGCDKCGNPTKFYAPWERGTCHYEKLN